MKVITASVLALAVILAPVINARAASCSLTLTKRSLTSKSVTLDGVSVSPKLLEALSKQCSINVKDPSISDLIAAEQAASAKRIAKLKAKAN